MMDFGYYNMDCMDGMKEFPDKYFDIAVVDPPYGININCNIGRRKGDKKSAYPKAHIGIAKYRMKSTLTNCSE